MAFHDLSNENIVFLYLENKESLKQFEKVINDKGIRTEIELPLFGKQTHIHPITDEILSDMINSETLKQIKQINKVLEPIVLLIEGSDPDLYKRIEDGINTRFNV